MNKVVKAVLTGMNEAHEKYHEWADEWLWNAPEYLMTVNIASQLKNKTNYVTLENGVRKTIKDSGASSRGRLKDSMRPNGKSDILLWTSYDKPKAVIEVKNQPKSYSSLKKDVDRIIGMLEKSEESGTLEFGVIAFHISLTDFPTKKSKARLNDKISNIISSFKKHIEPMGYLAHGKHIGPKTDGEDSWCSTCLVISPS